MSARINDLERQIRGMTPGEQSELFARIDDLYGAELERMRTEKQAAALKMGIDPDDDGAVQRLVNEVRYGNPNGRVG